MVYFCINFNVYPMKTRILLLSFIALSSISAFAQNVPSYVPSNGLVGWWPFNGNANDESGSGNNGTVNGATLTTDRFNLSNKAYYFGGQSKFIDLGSAGLSSNPSVCSYSVWFKLNTLYTGLYNETSIILSKRHQDNGPSWTTIQIDSNCMVNFVVDGPAFNQDVLGSSSICNDQWQHLVCIKNQNVYSVYLNSILVNSQTIIYNHNGSNLNMHVGHQGAWDTWFIGSIDDIGIWNRALTQQEITDLYNGTSANAAERNLTTVNVHPNPTSGEITITSNETYLQSYSLYNSLGQLVASGMLNPENTTLSIQELAPGIYTLQLQGEKNTALKIVKE